VAFEYEVVTISRDGSERVHEYSSEEQLDAGDVLLLTGRWWLIERVEPSAGSRPARAFAEPALYRLTLRHPDGREEVGAFRRYRPDGPRLGHMFTTLVDGQPVSWEVVAAQLEQDDEVSPYLELIAERNYAEAEGELPDHELEHTLARQAAEEPPDAAVATLGRAEQAGLAVELASLEAGEEPDWAEAERFIDALIIEEIGDDLLELCGVNTSDPQETWLETVKARLRSDLDKFRDDVEGEHEQIEEWDFRGARIFASVGTVEDESDPGSGHGWLCRLNDSDALGAAGFERVRKAELF
jgi:hypothetical protein